MALIICPSSAGSNTHATHQLDNPPTPPARRSPPAPDLEGTPSLAGIGRAWRKFKPLPYGNRRAPEWLRGAATIQLVGSYAPARPDRSSVERFVDVRRTRPAPVIDAVRRVAVLLNLSHNHTGPSKRPRRHKMTSPFFTGSRCKKSAVRSSAIAAAKASRVTPGLNP